MKRMLLTFCLTTLTLLVACDRYPGQQVEAPREQPGASIEEYKEATTDDKLLDNTIPGTNDNLGADTAPAATGVADTLTTELPPVESPDIENLSPDPVSPGSVDAAVDTAVDTAAVGTDGDTSGAVETAPLEEAATADTTVAAETTRLSLDVADTDLLGRSSVALEGADTAQAVAVIEAWQARLATLDDAALADTSLDDADVDALNDDMAALKAELQAVPVDESAVRGLLYELGVQTSRLALAMPQEVGDALNTLGTVLSEAGEASDIATAPVSVDGAMPGVTQEASTGAATSEVTTVRPDVSPPEAPGALDMNLQTGTVERDDLGVLDASLALPTKVDDAAVDDAASVASQPATAAVQTTDVQTAQANVTSSQAPEVTEGELLASANLQDAAGVEVGVVNLVSSDAGISFEFGLTDGVSVTAGEHGFHVHEIGTCEPDFEAAGAHLNPDGASHGLLSANGPHAGDLPNLVIPEDSAPTYVVTTMRLTPENLFDADGSAVIIHAGPDDYVTDPGGNSGDRVACGVLERVGSSQ
ncbi:hypothetical protein BH24DEI2_BH24DEI2_04090 [soil metagenome]